MKEVWDAIVIGGGQAGLASGYHLQKNGLRFLILEANERAVGSWPNYFWCFGGVVPRSRSVIDLGQYKERLAAGKPDQRPMFSSFHADGVIWPDGTTERVDTVIFATGYRPHLVHLRNMGALDSEGRPLQTAGISTTVPGLYYVGLEGQQSFASATLRGVGPDAKFVVQKLLRHLKK
jgi:putative flavoprotein involved in K+ transport